MESLKTELLSVLKLDIINVIKNLYKINQKNLKEFKTIKQWQYQL
jgi:septum formation topological specificity factor MinE